MEQIESRTMQVSHISDRKVTRRIHTLGNGKSRTPLVPQDIQTDAAVGVDVGVVYASGKVDLGSLEGVVRGEMDRQEENTARVWGVAWTHDGGLPVELVSLVLT